MNDENLAKRIKNIRLNQGLTQKEFAEKINVKKSAVSNWEQGLNGANKQTLKRIADIGGITVGELINGKVEKIPLEIIETLEQMQSYALSFANPFVDSTLNEFAHYIYSKTSEILEEVANE